MEGLRRAGKFAAGALALGVYLWFAAVGNADEARARKAASRRRRRST